MAPKKEAAKKSTPARSTGPAPASTSSMPKGSGSLRKKKRLITVYSPPKTFKTTSLSNLPLGRTKWVASDPNCVACLDSLGRLPHDDDIYEFRTLTLFREFLEGTLKIAETEGPAALGIDNLVLDSATQYSDWAQQAVAAETGQRFLGDDQKNNGWQQFNAEFGTVLDLLAALTMYINVFVICHAKAKVDTKKGEYSGLSLSPAMAEKLGRLSNWVLFKTFSEVFDDDLRTDVLTNKRDSPYYVIIRDPEEEAGSDKHTRVFETLFHTRPYNGWFASVEKGPLAPEEPGTDIMVLLEKAGLV